MAVTLDFLLLRFPWDKFFEVFILKLRIILIQKFFYNTKQAIRLNVSRHSRAEVLQNNALNLTYWR